MDKRNRKSMQIPNELLAEKNYEGTRLIEITDENVMKLKKELDVFQAEANPILDEMAKHEPVLDEHYKKVGEIRKQLDELNEEVKDVKETNLALLKQVEAIDAKAQLVKNKIQPIVLELVKDQLGEFEKAMQMKEVDGKLFVEIQDEIEETIKRVRASKDAKVL